MWISRGASTRLRKSKGAFAPFAGPATTGLARVASLVLLPIHVGALAAALPRFGRPR